MLYTKIQSQSFLGSREEDFQEFLPYMDMAAILYNCAKPFEQIGNTLSTDGPVKNGENCSSSSREEIYKLHNFIHVYSPVARADNPQGTKF